ncbi:MAG TPA: hypothetical protein VFT27_06290 [Actinomycetota bacterium]|nr:hypothetical protein [Actinomycetota bacterium]
MVRHHGPLLVAVLVFALTTLVAGAAWAQTPTPSPSPTPIPAPGPEGLSPATIVIGLILIAGFLLLRTRMGRAGR